MTLPVRVGVRVTRSALHTTLSVAARAMTLAGDTLQSVTGHDDHPLPAPSRSAETAVPDSATGAAVALAVAVASPLPRRPSPVRAAPGRRA